MKCQPRLLKFLAEQREKQVSKDVEYDCCVMPGQSV